MNEIADCIKAITDLNKEVEGKVKRLGEKADKKIMDIVKPQLVSMLERVIDLTDNKGGMETRDEKQKQTDELDSILSVFKRTNLQEFIHTYVGNDECYSTLNINGVRGFLKGVEFEKGN